MTPRFPIIFLCSVSLAIAQNAQKDDILHFADGHVERARLSEVTDDFIVLKPSPPATTPRTLERATVDFVEFSARPEMERAEKSEGLARIDALRRVWYLLRPTLEMPESPAGAWGMKFANAILHSDIEDNVKLSFEVFKTIEARDWMRARRHEARRGRFNAMLNLGMMDEALAESAAIAANPEDEDPALLITAKGMLGDLAFKNLKSLEQENPRWELDDAVRPQRNALVDECMDHYLFPHLYHGDRPNDAARGLHAAVKVLLFTGDTRAAALRMQDLRRLYPESPEATTAPEAWESDEDPTEAPPATTPVNPEPTSSPDLSTDSP